MPKIKQFVEETPTERLRPEDIQPAPKSNVDYLTSDGREKPSSIPMAPPIGFKKQEPLHMRIKQMIRSEKLAQEALAAGAETFDEADDFDIGDDVEPNAPYEEQFDPVGFEPGATRRAATERAAAQAAAAAEGRDTAPQAKATTEPLTSSETQPNEGPEAGGAPQNPPAGGPLGSLLRRKKT